MVEYVTIETFPAARIPLNRLLFRPAIAVFSPLAVRKGIHWHCKFNFITGRSNGPIWTTVIFWAVVVDMPSGRYCQPPELKGCSVAKLFQACFPSRSSMSTLWSSFQAMKTATTTCWHNHSRGWINGGICVENIQLINGCWNQGGIKCSITIHFHRLGFECL